MAKEGNVSLSDPQNVNLWSMVYDNYSLILTKYVKADYFISFLVFDSDYFLCAFDHQSYEHFIEHQVYHLNDASICTLSFIKF